MLKHFPLGFERLKRLKVLWITWCQALEGFRTQWKGSYHYSLMGVLGWDIFHLVSGKLIRLKYLNLEVCKDIEWLSNVVEQLTALKTLNVYQCSNLKSLPLGLGKLSILKHLDLEECIRVKTLPDSIGQFGSLRTLQFNPTIIIVFPDSLGDLTSLRLIQIYDRVWYGTI